MNNVDDELQHVLEELFTDLFQSRRPADAAPFLRALASLAASSSSAQKRLGQSLLADASSSSTRNPHRVTRLQLIAELFLYTEHSAVETLTLFAVLAQDNVTNQRRIARHVRAVSVSIPQVPSSSRQSPTLLVLSLPTSLQVQYQAWNTRQRALLSHRVPTGSPPALDGVPAACYCDECLGLPRLLTTWVGHYGDLSRWRPRNDNDTEGSFGRRLSSEEFLEQTLIADHCLRQYRCVLDGKTENGTTGAMAGLNTDVPAIYFFAAEGDEPFVGVPDPRRFACAIQIDPSVVDVVRSKPIANGKLIQQCAGTGFQQSLQKDGGEDDCDGLEQVLLLERRMEIPHYQLPREREFCPHVMRPWLPTIARIISAASMKSASKITAGWLRSQVDETQSVADWERRIFASITSFLDSDLLLDVIVIRKMLQLDCESCIEQDEEPSRMEVCDVRVVGTFDGQTLEIVASNAEGNDFIAQLSIADVKTYTNSEDDEAASLLSISDASLVDALEHCRLRRCSNGGLRGQSDFGSWIHLVQRYPTRLPAQTRSYVVDNTPVKKPISIHGAESRGLSPAAERQLGNLSLALTSEKDVTVLDISNRIRRIVEDCNERIAKLVNDSAWTESQRKAVRERCRACRDLLIEAAKRMKLGIKSDATATLATVARTRLQRAISRVVQLSESEDEWEKPDERVQRLHLNRQVWASGVPDPEFYVDSEARANTNRTTQRRLNLRLVQQMRQQRTAHS